MISFKKYKDTKVRWKKKKKKKKEMVLLLFDQ